MSRPLDSTASRLRALSDACKSLDRSLGRAASVRKSAPRWQTLAAFTACRTGAAGRSHGHSPSGCPSPSSSGARDSSYCPRCLFNAPIRTAVAFPLGLQSGDLNGCRTRSPFVSFDCGAVRRKIGPGGASAVQRAAASSLSFSCSLVRSRSTMKRVLRWSRIGARSSKSFALYRIRSQCG